MKKAKKARLEKHGYRITDTKEFLGLSEEEMALINLKICLIDKIKEVRQANKITQRELARIIDSSQSRVAMMEGGAADVSLDLICKALFALGCSNKDMAKTINARKAA